ASANLRSIPSFFASSCMSLEKAGRQSPSSPTWENPMVTANAEDPAKTKVAATAAPPSHFMSCILSSSRDEHVLGASAVGRNLIGDGLTCIRPPTANYHTIGLMGSAVNERQRGARGRIIRPRCSQGRAPRTGFDGATFDC